MITVTHYIKSLIVPLVIGDFAKCLDVSVYILLPLAILIGFNFKLWQDWRLSTSTSVT